MLKIHHERDVGTFKAKEMVSMIKKNVVVPFIRHKIAKMEISMP